jgi:streptogramin lyase
LAVAIRPLAAEKAGITAEEKELYENFTQLDFNTPLPWGAGPRRLGADKHGDVLWVCDFWDGNLARIDTHTRRVTLVPIPNGAVQYPYHAAIDRHHEVWVNMMNSDQVMRYDPKSRRLRLLRLADARHRGALRLAPRARRRMEVVVPELRGLYRHNCVLR